MGRNATKHWLQVAKSTAIRVQRDTDLESPKPSFAFVLFNYLFPFRGISGGGGWRPYGTLRLGNKLLPQPQGCDWRGRHGPERLCGDYFPASASRKARWLDPSWEGRRPLVMQRERGQEKNLPVQRHLYLHVVWINGQKQEAETCRVLSLAALNRLIFCVSALYYNSTPFLHCTPLKTAITPFWWPPSSVKPSFPQRSCRAPFKKKRGEK